jgi:acyl carrier protein
MTERIVSEEVTWLIGWFEQHGAAPAGSPEQVLATNYFDAKLIDSMGVIELIADAESEFDIAFTELHFQDRRFVLVGGFAEIVSELRAAS